MNNITIKIKVTKATEVALILKSNPIEQGINPLLFAACHVLRLWRVSNINIPQIN